MAKKQDNIIVAPMTLGDLLLNTPSAIIVANSLGRIISVSSATQDLLGWVPGELIGKPLSVMVPERLMEAHASGLKRWAESGDLPLAGKALRLIAVHKDGHEFPVQLTLGSYTSEEGDLRVVGMIDNIQEVIDLENRSDELQQELRFVRSVVMNLGEGLIAIDLDGTVTMVNDMATKLLGWTEEELLGKNGHYIFHSHAKNNFLKIEDCTARTSMRQNRVIVIEDCFLKKDETTLSVLLTTAPIYKDNVVVGAVDIFSDITQRKEEEEILRLSEKKYRDLVELSPDGMGIHVNAKFIFTNKALLKMMGADSFSDIDGMTLYDFIHPDYHNFIRDRLGSADSGNTLELVQEKGIRLNGEIVSIEVASMPIIYLGKPALLSIIRDISDRLLADEYRYILASVVDSNDDSIIVHNPTGVITVWNKSSERMYGWAEEEMIGRQILDIVCDNDYFNKTIQLVMAGNRMDHQTVNRHTKDNGDIKVDINLSPIYDSVGNIVGISEIGREFNESQIVSSNNGPSIS